MRTPLRSLKMLGMLGIAGGLIALSACSGGLTFNGNNQSGRISPRTLPVVHFPIPLESYNEFEDLYEIDGTVVFQGRNTASPHPTQPVTAEPQTIALPVAPTTFVFKSSTDVWEMTGTQDRNGDMVVDILQVGGPPMMAGAMAMTCQWMVQNINGQPRSDTPVNFEGLDFTSIEISIIGHGAGTPANNAPTGAAAFRHSPVSNRIGLLGAVQQGEDVITSNIYALNSPVGMPGTHNRIEFALGGGLPNIVMGKFQESPQENLFIEDDGGLLVPTAPVPGYFDASGRASVFGGLFINTLSTNVVPSYDPNLNIAWYYWGAVTAHIMGNGLGLPQVAFAVPGSSSNGEEDIMNVNVETDMFFYATAGRRFQFTAEGLLHMQNVQRFPLGSQSRADAEQRSQLDPFALDGISIGETTPGPNR